MSIVMAGTINGGTIRTLTAPWAQEPNAAAARAVLVSWCAANGMPADRILDRHPIEIRPHHLDGPGYVIVYQEVLPREPNEPNREARTTPRSTPLIVEPEGMLDNGDTCGHVHRSSAEYVNIPPAFFVCDQGIDPVTGRHPGPHAGGHHRHPIAGGRREWENENPGYLEFRGGIPYVGNMSPTDAHTLVLARLEAIVEARPGHHLLLAVVPHLRGLRKIAERHAPRRYSAPAAGGPLCERRCSGWPCPDYRQALAGIVTFRPEAPART